MTEIIAPQTEVILIEVRRGPTGPTGPTGPPGVFADGAVMETDFAAAGDMAYASAANTVSMLGIGSNGQVLTVTALQPAWQTPTQPTMAMADDSADLYANVAPVVGKLAFQLDELHPYICTVVPAVWKKLAFEDECVKHALATAIGDILYASGVGAFGVLPDVAVGSVLVSGGIGAAPAWSAAPSLTSLTAPSLRGSAAAGGSLTLHSTIHATKGKILFGNSQYDEATDRLSLGTANQNAGVTVGGSLSTTGGGDHGFRDERNLAIAVESGSGYASFDAQPTLNNTNAFDHFVGFQSRPIYGGAGGLTGYFAPAIVSAVHSGAGTVVDFKGIWINAPGGAGPITNCYGLYISNMTRGTLNYAIYSAGGTNFLNGQLHVNNRVGILTTDPQTNFDLGTGYAKTGSPGIYAYLGKSNDAVNFSAVQLLSYGGATQPARRWGFQTIELGVLNGGTITFQPNGGNAAIGVWGPAGDSCQRGLIMGGGVAPTTFPADMAHMLVKDQAAGNACFHFYTELGKIIKLYQQAHLADLNAAYGAGELDTEAEVITAMNLTNAKINSLLLYMENLGFIAAS